MPYPELKGLLTDIGTEELGHLEMIGAVVHQLTRDLTVDEVKKAGFDAYCLLRGWCAMAEATNVPELEAMANTIRNHIKGILGYWKLGGATNASMEGFNGKVRWLITSRPTGSGTSSTSGSRYSTSRQPTSASGSRRLSRITGKSHFFISLTFLKLFDVPFMPVASLISRPPNGRPF